MTVLRGCIRVRLIALGITQLQGTSVGPTTGIVIYQVSRLVPEFKVLLTRSEEVLGFPVSQSL